MLIASYGSVTFTASKPAILPIPVQSSLVIHHSSSNSLVPLCTTSSSSSSLHAPHQTTITPITPPITPPIQHLHLQPTLLTSLHPHPHAPCPPPPQAEPPVNVRFVVAVHEEQQWRQVTWACEPCQAQQPLQRLMAQVKQRADVAKPGIRLMALHRGTPVNDSQSPASLKLHTGQFIVLIDVQQVVHLLLWRAHRAASLLLLA
jgi:hypothetical protein